MRSPVKVLHQIDNSQYYFPPVEYALKSSINRLVTPITFKTLLQSWSYLVSPMITLAHRAHSWVRLPMTDFLPAVYIVPSSIVTAIQLGGSFVVITSFVSPSHVSKLFHFFNNKFLPSSSSGYPRAMVISFMVLIVFEIHPTNNLRWDMSPLWLDFLFGHLWLLGWALFPV